MNKTMATTQISKRIIRENQGKKTNTMENRNNTKKKEPYTSFTFGKQITLLK